MNLYFSKSKVIYLLLIMTLIIDGINGFMLHVLGMQMSIIGIIYRLIILCYFMYIYISQNLKNLIRSTFIILYFAINISLAYFLYNNSVNAIIFDFIECTRIMLSISIALGLITAIKYKYISRDILKKFMFSSVKIMCYIYCLSIILGLGRSTYGDAGYKAIFNSTNGINITLIILFIFQIEKITKSKVLMDKVYLIIIGIALILLGTKSSIIFILFYAIMKILLENKILKLLKFIVGLLVAIVVVTILINNIFTDQFQEILNRQQYMFMRSDNSILTFLFSGRNELLKSAYINFRDNISLNRLIFGIGSYYNQFSIGEMTVYTFKSIEMDLFDIFFSNGIIGVLLTYGMSISIFIKNFKKLKIKRYYSEIISYLSIIIFSITGGHVFTDAMASTFLGVIIALCYISKIDEKEELINN